MTERRPSRWGVSGSPSNPARVEWERDIMRAALQAIVGPMDDPIGLDWRMEAYREAGGGYEGLQEIAQTALATCATAVSDVRSV